MRQEIESRTIDGVLTKIIFDDKKEYIERGAVYKALRLVFYVDGREPSTTEIDMDIFEAIPAADVEPVVHVHWEFIKDDFEWFRCSKCKGVYFNGADEPSEARQWLKMGFVPNFCLSCGAHMDERSDRKTEQKRRTD